MAGTESSSDDFADHAMPVDPGLAQGEWSVSRGDPAARLEELAARLEIIPLPSTRMRSIGAQTPSHAMIKLRGRLRDATGWLRGRRDALGLTHSADNVGRILYGTVEDCLGDKQWSAAMRIAVGVDVWPMLAGILKDVANLALSLQKDAVQ